MKNVVVIGGGTGLTKLLRGLKLVENIDLTAIVTIADDGGSTGHIREHFNIPAVGDLRRVITALSPDETGIKSIMNYRFESKTKNSDFDNHALGNMIITAIIEQEKNFYKGIKRISNILNIAGRIIPISNNSQTTLTAELENGEFVVGEHNIGKAKAKIKRITHNDIDEDCNPEAVLAILKADIIVFGIGSLYTSVIPNLIYRPIQEAMKLNTKANYIYFGNIMTQDSETTGMNMEDHIKAIEDHIGIKIIDTVIINDGIISDDVLDRYKAENCDVVKTPKSLLKSDVKVIFKDLINPSTHLIEHDDHKIADVITEIIGE